MNEICISIRVHLCVVFVYIHYLSSLVALTTQDQTCQVSLNRRECHAFKYNLTLTRKEGKISRNFSNLTHLSIFSQQKLISEPCIAHYQIESKPGSCQFVYIIHILKKVFQAYFRTLKFILRLF